MAFFQHLKDEFTSLIDFDLTGQWTNIALNELTDSEQYQIRQFHKLVGGDSVLDESNVLLVQAEGGFLKDVYAASLRQVDGALAIKLGANIYPATIEVSERKIGSRTVKEYVIACGELFGAVQFADKESEADIRVDNQAVKVSYTRCWVDFGDGSGDEWRVPLTLDLAKQPSKTKTLAAIENGTLAELLKPATGGSGSNGEARSMADLGEGLFPVAGIRSVTTANGERYLIFVDGFGDVWSRGGADRQLNNPEQRVKIDAALAEGGLALAVGNIQTKETKEGKKTYLDSSLRIKKTLVAATPAPVKPTPEATPDYDEIPF